MISRLILFLVLVITFCESICAQKTFNVDSLKEVLATPGISESSKIIPYINLANHYIYFNLDTAQYYIDEALKLEEIENVLPDSFYKHLLIKGWTHQGKGEFESAKVFMLKAHDIVEKHGDRKSEIELSMNVGSILVDLKDTLAWSFVNKMLEKVDTTLNSNEKASWILGQQYLARIFMHEGNYLKGLEILTETNRLKYLRYSPNHRWGILSLMSQILVHIGDESLSRKYLFEALDQPGLLNHEVKFLTASLAEHYITQGKLDTAEYYLNKIPEMKPLSEMECHSYHFKLAKVLYQKKNYNSARTNIDQAISCSKEMQNADTFIHNHLIKGRILLKQDKPDGVKNQIRLIEDVIKSSPEAMTLRMKNAFNALKLKLEMYNKAPQLLVQYDDHYASVTEENRIYNDQRLKELSAYHETEKKELEIDNYREKTKLQENSLQNYKRSILGLITSLLLMLGLLITTYRFYLLRKKHNLILEEEKDELTFQNKELKEVNEQLRFQQEKLSQKNEEIDESITVVVNRKNRRIELRSIVQLTAKDNGVNIELVDGEVFWIDERLSKILAELPDELFVRVHRSHVINRIFVEEYSNKEVTLKTGKTVKISKTYKDNILDA